MSIEPDWLRWGRELQAIAQTGLAYSRDPYDLDRYTQLRSLTSKIMAAHTGEPSETILSLFAGETGYPTPKIDVRGAVFDTENRLLMVREIADGGRWTLPGGWADANTTPAECVAKEIREESGFTVHVRKLAAVWDRTRQGHANKVFSCWKLFFLCDLAGGSAQTSIETSEVGWFSKDAVPQELSLERVLPQQLERMFVHAETPGLATDFE